MTGPPHFRQVIPVNSHGERLQIESPRCRPRVCILALVAGHAETPGPLAIADRCKVPLPCTLTGARLQLVHCVPECFKASH